MYLRQAEVFEAIASFCDPPSGPGWSSHVGQIKGTGWLVSVSHTHPLGVSKGCVQSPTGR